jgi:rubrerythrin
MESALQVLQLAIHNEITGQRFYDDAAYLCIDPRAKEIFSTLAREEEGHTRILLAEYEALANQGRWLDLEIATARGARVDVTRFSFPEDGAISARELFPSHRSAEDTIDRRTGDLAALTLGIQMEQKAIALYGQEARTTHDPAARQAYRFLVEEETRHYDQLKAQWEMMAGISLEEVLS